MNEEKRSAFVVVCEREIDRERERERERERDFSFLSPCSHPSMVAAILFFSSLPQRVLSLG